MRSTPAARGDNESQGCGVLSQGKLSRLVQNTRNAQLSAGKSFETSATMVEGTGFITEL